MIIGVDIGGTNIRLGSVEHAAVLHQHKEPVGNRRTPAAIVQLLANTIAHVQPTWGRPRAIGIGAPGIVDPRSGVIHQSPHFPEWQGFALRDTLQQALGCPVALDNDANAIASGELQFGAGRTLQNFLMITLGTGIGGGIVINRQIFCGDRGFAGEIGHLVVDMRGAHPGIGGDSAWESFASASGLHRVIAQCEAPVRNAATQWCNGDVRTLVPADVTAHARTGDAHALAIWNQFGRIVGVGLASLVNILGIDHIVFGGGLSDAFDLFASAAHAELATRTYAETMRGIVLHRAKLGDDAGILGAASLADALLRTA